MHPHVGDDDEHLLVTVTSVSDDIKEQKSCLGVPLVCSPDPCANEKVLDLHASYACPNVQRELIPDHSERPKLFLPWYYMIRPIGHPRHRGGTAIRALPEMKKNDCARACLPSFLPLWDSPSARR